MSGPIIKFEIDASSIASQFKNLASMVERNLIDSIEKLSIQTKEHVNDNAQEKLKSTRNKYQDALSHEQINDNTWVVALDASAFFIEEGLPQNFDMKPGLLKGKDYRVIPFKYNILPQNTPKKSEDLVKLAKKELAKRKISLQDIEKENGKDKLGKLHEFSFASRIPGRGNTPALTRLSVWQKQVKNERTGKIETRRDILTFRTVKAGSNKWFHPGLEPKKFLDEALIWAQNKWESEILPQLLEKWKNK